jgi:hypothetical protein
VGDIRYYFGSGFSLAKMPVITWSTSFVPNPFGVHPAELLRPIPHCFIGHRDAAISHDFFNIAVAQGETELQPDAMTDDFRRKTPTIVQRLSGQVLRAAWSFALIEPNAP